MFGVDNSVWPILIKYELYWIAGKNANKLNTDNKRAKPVNKIAPLNFKKYNTAFTKIKIAAMECRKVGLALFCKK